MDGLHEIITAVEATPGAVNEAQRMASLIDVHALNTGTQLQTVVADSQYGTIENLLVCHDRNIKAHMPTVHHRNKHTGSRKGIYPEESFVYEESTDTYRCPAGKELSRVCALKARCTRDNTARSVQRFIRKKELDAMFLNAQSNAARSDIKTRQHCMERSYARSARYGFDRARWRGLWKVAIQEYLICSIQNIEALIRYTTKPKKASLRLSPSTMALPMMERIVGSCRLFLVNLLRQYTPLPPQVSAWRF